MTPAKATCESPAKGRPRRSGFTLVELMIVVVILGILAAIVVPQLSEGGTDARFSALAQNLTVVRKQITLYKMQHSGQLPTLTDFAAQLTGKTHPDGTPNAGGTRGPYLERIPINPFTVGGGNDVSSDPAGVSKAWYYDQVTGQFLANDGGATNGKTHDSL